MSDNKKSDNKKEKKKENKSKFWEIINSKIVIFGLALFATYVVIGPILNCIEKKKRCEHLEFEIGYRLENIEDTVSNDEYLLAAKMLTREEKTYLYPEFEKRHLVSLAYEYREISRKNKKNLNNLLKNFKELCKYKFDNKTKKDFYEKFGPMFKDIYAFLGVSYREFSENESTLNKESKND